MIIIGAKGFAKELLEVCHQLGRTENLVFFDNVSSDLPEQLYGQFPILLNEKEVKDYFNNHTRDFALGLGNPILRKNLCELFENWGGILNTIISPQASIAKFDTVIGPGSTILAHATITGSVRIGKGLLMYPNALVTHDCVLGDFVELSPGATILGNSRIGNKTHVGANACILPRLSLGEEVVVGAGSVVTKSFSDRKIIKGIPAK